MQPENQPSAPATPPPQTPSQPVQPPVEQPAAPAPETVPQSVSTPEAAPVQPVQDTLGSVAVADQVEGGYGYEDDSDPANGEGEIDLSQPVTWEAREYIHQEKGATWFILFAVVFVLFMVVAIFLMQSWSFAILLVVIAAVIVVLAKRPPRLMEYTLSEEGLHIDETLHKYGDFKSFGVIRDGEEFSVMLIPRRRFQPGITVYFPEEIGEDVVDILGSRLPMRDLHLDVVDRLVRKLRL